MPPLPIKLRLIKHFVKRLNKDCPTFQFRKQKFSKLSEAKIKKGVFVGPDIKKLIEDSSFTSTLNPTEKEAWNAFIDVVKNFLGNNKSADFRDKIKVMLDCYYKMGCNMSLKLHFLHSHLSFSPKIWAQLAMNKENVFIKILPQLRGVTREDGNLLC